VLNCAVFPLRAIGAPAFDPSITNCTVPVGVPDPGATTDIVAVKVTFWPGVDGLADEVTLVVVLALLTAMGLLVPVMEALLVSVAVIV